ncbi:pyridoxamine 5'-phosphate oxidase [Leptospira santarosai str. CBC1416]|uniref:Pyridoxamine 5'-phosphate oxidase n=1 Tax=Leptospira santarosai str. CBC1416 TaxID=1193059 RepID=M6VXB5_9LEPT|nr:pyridoxamine 5'-phosphate oxidase [Leptospira santarosai str. CBC1416]
MNSKISEIRKNYSLSSLDTEDAGDDPISFFQKWFEEAVLSEVLEVNAMTLATATKEGKPNARIVLLKGIVEGSFVFYTNYESKKGRELEGNPRVCLVFFLARVGTSGTNRRIRNESFQGGVERVLSFQTQRISDRRGCLSSE